MTCEYWQTYARTALLWASCSGHADTVRVLVELGASVEAVDKVNIHAHALANTCCIKHVSGIMRMTMIMMSHAYAYIHVYTHSYVDMHIHMYVCIRKFMYYILFFCQRVFSLPNTIHTHTYIYICTHTH
jgi:hypothetical protein